MSQCVRSTGCRRAAVAPHPQVVRRDRRDPRLCGFRLRRLRQAGQARRSRIEDRETSRDRRAGGSSPRGDNQVSAHALAVELPHPGDRCDTAVPLTLNVLTKGTTTSFGVHCELDPSRVCAADVDCAASSIPPLAFAGACVRAAAAADDYQTPATGGCYPGDQFPTNATGRDIVFSFTAPADGNYTFRAVAQSPTDPLSAQNGLLYLTDCANSGVVNCLGGANRGIASAFTSSKGGSNNRGRVGHLLPDDQRPDRLRRLGRRHRR